MFHRETADSLNIPWLLEKDKGFQKNCNLFGPPCTILPGIKQGLCRDPSTFEKLFVNPQPDQIRQCLSDWRSLQDTNNGYKSEACH